MTSAWCSLDLQRRVLQNNSIQIKLIKLEHVLSTCHWKMFCQHDSPTKIDLRNKILSHYTLPLTQVRRPTKTRKLPRPRPPNPPPKKRPETQPPKSGPKPDSRHGVLQNGGSQASYKIIKTTKHYCNRSTIYIYVTFATYIAFTLGLQFDIQNWHKPLNWDSSGQPATNRISQHTLGCFKAEVPKPL